MSDEPVIVAVVSDMHTNSTVGLCPPRFQLDDGGEYVASKAQRWLWRNWVHYWARVQVKAEELNAKVITVFAGDVYDGDHHNTPQIVTRNLSDMKRLAWQVLERGVQMSEQVYVIRGTVSHVGEGGWLEESLANDLDNAVHDETSASWWHLPLIVNGVFFDIGHPRQRGQLPWTASNWANRFAVETMLDYYGTRCPDVVIRAHRHKIISSDSERRGPRVFGLPAFQLATGYVHGFKPGALADIGGMIFVCQDGRYEYEMVRYEPKRRAPVRVAI